MKKKYLLIGLASFLLLTTTTSCNNKNNEEFQERRGEQSVKNINDIGEKCG